MLMVTKKCSKCRCVYNGNYHDYTNTCPTCVEEEKQARLDEYLAERTSFSIEERVKMLETENFNRANAPIDDGWLRRY